MREILFRGKRIDNGKWEYSSAVSSAIFSIVPDKKIFWLFVCDETLRNASNGGGWVAVHSKTVGQFTGLKDKNNRNIYDGDIIRYGKGANQYKIVRWNSNQASWNIRGSWKSKCSIWEVIGNIYDNPELDIIA